MNREQLRNGFSLPDINPLFKAGTGILSTVIGEQIEGRRIRQALRKDIDKTLEDPRFREGKEGESQENFMKKLSEFRPRMIGALSLYSSFSEQSYSEVAKSEGLESFYLFWRLADVQDDLIDTPKKHKENTQGTLNEIIFRGPDGKFIRGATHLLERRITEGRMGEKEKKYLKVKVAQWYSFLSSQEERIQYEDFPSFDFNYCRKYREDQNQKAGEVLIALLNWDKCLNPDFQKLETIIPRFSFSTQMVDDIADTVEDIEAQRPSFAVGALNDNPAEFVSFLAEVKRRDIRKVNLSTFREFTPEAYELITQQFQQYQEEMQSTIKGKGFSLISNSVYLYFPAVRDFLFKLNPEIANF